MTVRLMKSTLEKVINGFVLETKDGKRVGMTLNDILPTIYDMCQKEIKDCAEEVGQMCYELDIEINITPTKKQESDCEVKQVPCTEPAIGEVIEYKGKHLLCVEADHTCKGCYFEETDMSCGSVNAVCNGDIRSDGKSVIFVEGKRSKPWERNMQQQTDLECSATANLCKPMQSR